MPVAWLEAVLRVPQNRARGGPSCASRRGAAWRCRLPAAQEPKQPRSPCGGVAAQGPKQCRGASSPLARREDGPAVLGGDPGRRAGGRASWESSWEVRGEVAASVGVVAELHFGGTAAVKEQGHARELAHRRPRSGIRQGRGMRRESYW